MSNHNGQQHEVASLSCFHRLCQAALQSDFWMTSHDNSEQLAAASPQQLRTSVAEHMPRVVKHTWVTEPMQEQA